jgi:hypothetical protein
MYDGHTGHFLNVAKSAIAIDAQLRWNICPSPHQQAAR